MCRKLQKLSFFFEQAEVIIVVGMNEQPGGELSKGLDTQTLEDI